MRRGLVVWIGAVVAAAACGDGSSRATPTAPPPAPAILPDAPVARLSALVDYGTVALSNVQPVMLDARASTGEQLQYRIDYGDGTVDARSARPALAKPSQFFHAYTAAGGAQQSFVATVTVTDAFGRSATATATVLVRDVTGAWRSTITNPITHRNETRVLTLTQIGGRVSGAYTHPEGYSEPLSGSVDGPRTVKLAVDSRTIRFEGLDLDGTGLNETVTAMTVAVTGGSADGQRVTFIRQ